MPATLLAVVLLAAAQNPTSAPGARPPADQAKMALDLAEVELQAGKLYLTGLADLASRPGTWDRAHSVYLFNEAQRAVERSEEQLRELETLAVGNYPKAVEPLRRARASLVDTEHDLRAFAAPVRGGTYKPQDPKAIKELWHTVDRAQKDLQTAAEHMHVDYHLKAI
jgi:hypothetical protein